MNSEEILIGIDYGETNIGVALGRNGLVEPLRVISGKNINSAINELTRLALENDVKTFVVGLPLSADQKETKQSLKTRHFIKLLKIFTKKKVALQEEHGTSIQATQEAITTHLSKKKRKTNDHLAAALILKRYYEEQKEKK